MSYKNTIKLFATNFMLVWKQLLFLFVTTLVFGICAYTVSTPIIELLRANGAGREIISIFKTAYNSPSELFLYISNVFKHIVSLISSNFGHIYLSFIGVIFLGFLFPYILIQMSYFNLGSILYQKLSMNMEVNYFQNGIKTLKHSFLYAVSNLLFGIPFFALLILFVYVYVQIATTIVSSILGLIVMAALFIVVRSIKLSLFTCYTGYMVEKNCSPFVAFGKGSIIALKDFGRVLSTSITVILTIILVNGFIAIFTFLSGLIVIVPASFVFVSIYNLVIYFNNIGERYYLGTNLIFNPVKYSVKKDEVSTQNMPDEDAVEINSNTIAEEKKRKKTKSTPKNQSKTTKK